MIAGLSRDQIVKRFEEWLDSALASEEPLAGIDAEILAMLEADGVETSGEPEEASSYALWAAMTALSQEVKLQGRAFKELSATLAERERVLQRDAERQSRREILGSLLDLGDHLERGLESAKASAAEIGKMPKRGWLGRLMGSPAEDPHAAAVSALIKGYELSLDRLDQTLDDFNARPIRPLGHQFDPRRMNAIDRQESGSVPEGTVLEVYRCGYEWNGEVFRAAQVKVAVTTKVQIENE